MLLLWPVFSNRVCNKLNRMMIAFTFLIGHTRVFFIVLLIFCFVTYRDLTRCTIISKTQLYLVARSLWQRVYRFHYKFCKAANSTNFDFIGPRNQRLTVSKESSRVISCQYFNLMQTPWSALLPDKDLIGCQQKQLLQDLLVDCKSR